MKTDAELMAEHKAFDENYEGSFMAPLPRFPEKNGFKMKEVNMHDAMLGELYKRVFEEKQKAEALNKCSNDEYADRHRQAAIEKNKMLSELISIRTEQIRNGK